MYKKIIFFLLALLVSGCASPTLIVRSQPKGALISDVVSGRSYGIVKDDVYGVHIEYKLNPETKDQNGCYLLSPLKAEWPSGLSRQDTIRICGMKAIYTYTFSRPNGAGLDVDLDFAARIEAQENYRIKKNNAEIDDALFGIFNALSTSNRNQVDSPPTPTQKPSFLKSQWYNNSNHMCSYDDGSVINVGAGICPNVR
jgi:hypothetical protein